MHIDNLLRSSVAKQRGGWFLKNYSRKHETHHKDQERMFTIGKLSFRYPQINWFLSHLSSSRNTELLLDSIKNGKALAVSDGSFFPLEEVSSCAWIIATPDGKEWIRGGGVVPGESHDQSAYRSELAGQLRIAVILSDLQIEKGNYLITTACDGISALSRVGMSIDYIKSSMKHADMISYISTLWSKSNFSPNKVHVYGHRDDFIRPLTVLEYLNCEMDELAKLIARNQMVYNKKNFVTTTLGFGSVSCNGKLVVSKIRASLYSIILQQKNLTYLSDKLGIDNDSLVYETSWNSYGYARKEAG